MQVKSFCKVFALVSANWWEQNTCHASPSSSASPVCCCHLRQGTSLPEYSSRDILDLRDESSSVWTEHSHPGSPPSLLSRCLFCPEFSEVLLPPSGPACVKGEAGCEGKAIW